MANFSFDTSANLVLMEGNLPGNFKTLVPGQVGIYSFKCEIDQQNVTNLIFF